MYLLPPKNPSFVFLLIIISSDARYSAYDQTDAENFIQYSRPVIVSVRYGCREEGNLTTHCCSGVVLTQSYILTAADCIDRFPRDLTLITDVRSRSQVDRMIRKTDQVIIHPHWTSTHDSFAHNIALLHTSNPFDFPLNKHILQTPSDIRSSLPEDNFNYPSNSTEFLVIGWNSIKQKFETTISSSLEQTKMSLMDNNDLTCRRLIEDIQQHFCVRFYQTKSCNYESGESVFQWIDNTWVQVGLISAVVEETTGNCVKIYTRIVYYYQWIASILDSETVATTSLIANFSNTYECNADKVSCGCSFENVVLSPMRIIGGEEAVPHSWAMAVSVRLNNSQAHSCGGSILTESYILTSAHCVDGGLPLQVSIAAGMHNQVEDFFRIRYAHEIYIHPNWSRDDSTYGNDIAILYILPPLSVDGNPNLARACVPYISSWNETVNYPLDGSQLVVVGWGASENNSSIMSPTLQQASVYSLSNNDSICSLSIHDEEKQFCAGGQRGGPCQGDEGGPVFQWKDTYWEQVGITSYEGKCDQAGSPSIFTRLAYYFDWMESVTGISLTTTTSKPPPIPVLYSCNRTLACGCGKSDVALTSSRIVGGENAVENSWPMIVSIRLNGTINHSCGGTILSNSYILTVAHCFRQVSVEHPTGVTIAAGMTNRSDPSQIIRRVDRIYIHPNYTNISRDNRNDIALLHIDQPFVFEFNSNVTRACVHRIDPPLATNEYPKNGTRLSVIGWGTLWPGDGYLPEILQQVQVFTINNEEPICLTTINNTELQFCAGLFEGGKDSCQGDSGGPAFQWTGEYWEQVGIVSYGRGCAQVGFPGIYTRLSYYYHWMERILERDGEHLEPRVSPLMTTMVTTTKIATMTTTVMASSRAYGYEHTILIFVLPVLLLWRH